MHSYKSAFAFARQSTYFIVCVECVRSAALPRPNWSRKLPRPLKIPTAMTLTTLADVRELVEKHLPAECRQRETSQHVTRCIAAAALGGSVNDVAVALRLAPQIERVSCLPK